MNRDKEKNRGRMWIPSPGTPFGDIVQRFEADPGQWTFEGSSLSQVKSRFLKGSLLVRTLFRDERRELVLVQRIAVDPHRLDSVYTWGHFRPPMEGEEFQPGTIRRGAFQLP